MVPDRSDNTRRKERHEGRSDSVPTAVALTGRGFLYQCDQPTALLAIQVPWASSHVPDKTRKVLALLLSQRLVQAITAVLPQRPSDFPDHGPRNRSPPRPELPYRWHECFLRFSIFLRDLSTFQARKPDSWWRNSL